MKLRKILSVILSVVMIAAWITVPVSAEKGTVVYQKSGDWSITGEHNYLWVTSDLGLESGKKYIIEFGVTVPTINSWPSFMFDWRDGSNNTKTNVGWNGYIGLTGFFNDGSNDCICNAGEVWSGTVGREGGIVNYDYSIVWDTATSKFDITIDYTTPGGTTGTITDTFTSSSAYNGGDVLKFWANGEAIVKDLTIYNYYEFVPTIYTAENGWDLPISDGYQAKELSDGRLQMNHEVRFTPALEDGKKYSIKFDVTGLETGDAWTYQYRLALVSGGETLDGRLSYRQEGVWENGSESKWLASATDGEVEVIIDKATGAYEMYAHGVLSATGTFANTSDFTLKMYKWGGNAPYISNVRVEEIRENVIYTEENGWILSENDDGVKALETEDGKLQLNNTATFTPNLEENKKYSIKFDITGIETGDDWTYQFRLALISGGETLDGRLSYRQAGIWENSSESKWVANGTDGEIEVIIDKETGEYEMYALGALSASGTFADTSDFTLKFYKWGGNAPYISNVRVEELRKNVIYTAANGWNLPENDEGAKALETDDGKLQLNNEAFFTPTLEENKKYSIKFDVTGLETGDAWTYQFRLALIAGSTTLDGSLSYRQEGTWENGNEQKYVAGGTDGEVEVVIDTATGEYRMYALGALSASGTFTDISNFTLKFYRWGGNAPYISNVRVEEVRENVIYTEANGWTTPTSDSGSVATELEDGRLQLNNQAIFKPILEAGKKYSIKYNVTDLAYEADSWTFPFRVKMTAGGAETDGILAYRMANVWEARSLAIAHGSGSNEIIIDTKNNTWEAYALGSLSQYGTVESFNDFALTFYKWGGPSACIGNVTVEEIVFDGTYYKQNFDQIEAAFSNWRAATVNEVKANQPLQVWGGSFTKTDNDNYMLSSAMDIYPLAVTPKTDKYELNFDIKPNAATDPNGSNWEGIVMQWNLGSSNTDSWHDMKLGTSAGADVSGEVAIDRLWLFGKEMTIDPNEWININLVYDCKTGEINAKATQGGTDVTATAPFSVNTESLTGSPKITFEGIERNSVKYAGVFLNNIVIKVLGEDKAPVLSANSIKLYANDVEQQALNASAFTNKVEVVFGQVMWPEDMTADKIYVVDANGNKVTGDGISVTYTNDTYTITYENGFNGNQTYTVRVEKVRNIEGVYTLEVYEKSFYVASGVYAELISITQDGNVIEDIAELFVGNAKINLNYSNTDDESPVIHIVVAYYKEGKLVFTDCIKKESEKNATSIKYELDYSIKNVPGGCDEIQVMVWDGFNTIKPLSAPITL